jgi:hypothetical protein
VGFGPRKFNMPRSVGRNLTPTRLTNTAATELAYRNQASAPTRRDSDEPGYSAQVPNRSHAVNHSKSQSQFTETTEPACDLLRVVSGNGI